MKKKLLIVLLIELTNLESYLNSMEKESNTEEINQTRSLWQTLPIELQQNILCYALLDKDMYFEQILAKFKDLEKCMVFKNPVNNRIFIANLAKKYIEKNKCQAEDEFFIAIKENKLLLIQAFIDGGINVNAKDRYGKPALIFAVLRKNNEIAKMLLGAGANVNIRTEYNDTALFFGLLTNNQEIVKILLEYGA